MATSIAISRPCWSWRPRPHTWLSSRKTCRSAMVSSPSPSNPPAGRGRRELLRNGAMDGRTSEQRRPTPPPHRSTKVRVAVVQPASFAGEEEHQNAARACEYIDRAVDQGAAYVVFPEGYPGPYSGPMENDALERVKERARAHRVWVSAGCLERTTLPDTYHITHVLIDGEGAVRARYHRVQPNHPLFNAYLMGGRHHVLPGDELMAVDAPFGRIGLLICSELFVPELSRILMLRGADLI